ncbi:MAG: DNA-3-methyladenine glycosylase 2 family protein [Pseudomonadales bacterium]|nr:DNA-3-methyladenine glycosylase 2 family protein [Pseudomonadales bacterium]MBO6597728.1 DNA-3-methyladenine glycosylase 2 family protein [Pseudomonadales bacterium]MBO6658185.1 DNA-3-methyladenine glycosylase 2 family protein [Pseudomonadales bacterium]MBO6823966.1 DNA-3-methyladenine glycosylase 2 family protein [Pseudomonadales bacterium]
MVVILNEREAGMLPAGGILEQARKARDPRFDGRFFIAVRSTGIYCRPICPVKMPRAENVAFFESAAAASEAGYRPCLRCRPETAPGTPAWRGTSTTVTRALKLIHEGALDESNVSALSDRLGVTSRHLTRLFSQHLGASPNTVAQTRRLQFAKKLIDETRLAMTDVAMISGYGSVRRFNDHFQKTYGRTPGSLRKAQVISVGDVELKIAYRVPFHFDALLDFFRIRGIPGIEKVGDAYERSFFIDGQSGLLTVSDSGEGHLLCRVSGGSPRSLMSIVGRVRAMFDVDAVPEEISNVLSSDKSLRPLLKRAKGLRLPGAFDPFEVSVRAIVGQQVSVKGATTVMGRIADLYGSDTGHGRIFPDPHRLAELDPGALPMPRKRAAAIREMSSRVAEGNLRFDMDDDEFYEILVSVPGIGPWTAQYVAMRALADPDAFLHGDLVIKKVASELLGIDNEKALLARAEHWRPWRGYAGMYLWRYAAELSGTQ